MKAKRSVYERGAKRGAKNGIRTCKSNVNDITGVIIIKK